MTSHISRFTALVFLSATVFLLAVGLGCEEDSATNPPMSDAFSLRIAVQDVSGVPVPDLRVSVINELFWTLGGPVARGVELPRSSAAVLGPTIRFDVEERSDVTFEVFNQMDGLVKTVVDERKDAGSYLVAWLDTERFPSGLYKFVFTARDTVTGDTLFSDWKRSALVHQDPATSALGYTDAAGVFEMDEVLRFPHLVGATDQSGTDAIGNDTGTFVFSDTATVVLTDTTTSDTTMHRISVQPGANSVVLIWDPTPTPLRADRPERTAPAARTTHPPTAPVVPFKLYSPYPNPYE